MSQSQDRTPTYERVYVIVRQIPRGKVATYGQIAGYVDNCTARMVGFAMSALSVEDDVPWQRVINSQGKISPRGNDLSTLQQRELLESEGVTFNASGRVDFKRVRWEGPDLGWLLENGFDPEASWTETYQSEE